jgi:hypothetical protein
MGKAKPKRTKKEQHPTLFVLEGTIRYYEDGSMLQLHGLISSDEWEIVVEETVKYKVFLECLKSTGCPELGEPWTEEDDWFRIQLEIAVSRMRNIDPLLVANHDQAELTETYAAKMKKNAAEVQILVKQMRDQKKAALQDEFGDGGAAIVSDL